MVTVIYEVTSVLGLEPMDCTVVGIISTDPFFLLFLTSALTLSTPELFSPNGRSGRWCCW